MPDGPTKHRLLSIVQWVIFPSLLQFAVSPLAYRFVLFTSMLRRGWSHYFKKSERLTIFSYCITVENRSGYNTSCVPLCTRGFPESVGFTVTSLAAMALHVSSALPARMFHLRGAMWPAWRDGSAKTSHRKFGGNLVKQLVNSKPKIITSCITTPARRWSEQDPWRYPSNYSSRHIALTL